MQCVLTLLPLFIDNLEWLLQCAEEILLSLQRLSCECMMCVCVCRISFYLPLYLLINQ